MSDSVWVISAYCGDYYCGCGLGHLVGIATTEDEAERIRAEGEADTYGFVSHGPDGERFKAYNDVTVELVPLNELRHRGGHGMN